jgi:molecular chaperone GrpE
VTRGKRSESENRDRREKPPAGRPPDRAATDLTPEETAAAEGEAAAGWETLPPEEAPASGEQRPGTSPEGPAAPAPGPGAAATAQASEQAVGDVVPLEQHQRLLAEFDNYRKRVARDQVRLEMDFRARLIARILPVLDDFARARDSIGSAKHFDREGMLIIMNRLADVLRGEGLEEVRTLPGDPFDPEIHEAVLMVPTSAHPEGCVAEVFEKGYRIGERLLRPAKVAVAQASASGGSDPPA